jgi:hypothetical protein
MKYEQRLSDRVTQRKQRDQASDADNDVSDAQIHLPHGSGNRSILNTQTKSKTNQGIIMKKLLLGAFASVALLCISAGAWADQVSNIYTCKLEEGKTIADAQAVNMKWLAWMRANVSENINSVAATAVVGDSDSFMYVDTYPDLATWAAGQTALETDEGRAVEAGFQDVMDCSGNRLWRLRPTM